MLPVSVMTNSGLLGLVEVVDGIGKVVIKYAGIGRSQGKKIDLWMITCKVQATGSSDRRLALPPPTIPIQTDMR